MDEHIPTLENLPFFLILAAFLFLGLTMLHLAYRLAYRSPP